MVTAMTAVPRIKFPRKQRPGGGFAVEPLEERFWKRVNKTDTCWLWIGAKARYGFFSIRVKLTMAAHRFSWELHNGKIPKGLGVLHKCDVPLCVNPDHLFLGTQKDNSDDMWAKGRHQILKGESHGMAKLTKEQVQEIRASEGLITHRMMGIKYGVAESCIWGILRGKLWKSV